MQTLGVQSLETKVLLTVRFHSLSTVPGLSSCYAAVNTN